MQHIHMYLHIFKVHLPRCFLKRKDKHEKKNIKIFHKSKWNTECVLVHVCVCVFGCVSFSTRFAYKYLFWQHILASSWVWAHRFHTKGHVTRIGKYTVIPMSHVTPIIPMSHVTRICKYIIPISHVTCIGKYIIWYPWVMSHVFANMWYQWVMSHVFANI